MTALDSDSGGFQITLPASTSIHVTIGSATLWQGISSLTELHQRMFVDLDGARNSAFTLGDHPSQGPPPPP